MGWILRTIFFFAFKEVVLPRTGTLAQLSSPPHSRRDGVIACNSLGGGRLFCHSLFPAFMQKCPESPGIPAKCDFSAAVVVGEFRARHYIIKTFFLNIRVKDNNNE